MDDEISNSLWPLYDYGARFYDQVKVTGILLLNIIEMKFFTYAFVHSTMCAGDFAMLNYYHINRRRKIYTWDDADLREAYFYEEIQ